MIKDLTAGILPPEIPRYMNIKGMLRSAAACKGERWIVSLCRYRYGSLFIKKTNSPKSITENIPKWVPEILRM